MSDTKTPAFRHWQPRDPVTGEVRPYIKQAIMYGHQNKSGETILTARNGWQMFAVVPLRDPTEAGASHALIVWESDGPNRERAIKAIGDAKQPVPSADAVLSRHGDGA